MPLARQAKDEEREARIQSEMIVDASGPEEQALGWYYSLEGTWHFPFTARCIALRALSPVEPADELAVVGIAPEEECRHALFVLTRWKPHELAVPLMQVEAIDAAEETRQALEDWHSWGNRGYEL